MPDKCLECPVPSADMDGFIVSGPGGAPRSESAGVSAAEGPFAKEAPQTGHFILKGKVSSSSPLPDVPEPGWAYEAAEAGTYGGVQATAGDVVWCAGVSPVRWAILQSDSGSAVSVRQILSSGTKIATVAVGGQATDLYCEPSGLASVSASFECGGQTWYLSSHEVTGYVEDDNEYVVHAVAPALLDGDLSVDLSPTWVGGSESQYVLNRTFLLSNVPVYGDVCYRLAGGYDAYTIFVSEGYEDIAPEDLVLFSLWARIDNYSMPAAGEEIELPINLIDYNNTGILPVTEIGASASVYDCASRDQMVMHEMPDHLSASPLKFYATGPVSGNIGSLRVEKNSAFDWSRYESGAKLTLTSTSASGGETVQEVDMSCLGGGGVQTLSGEFACVDDVLTAKIDGKDGSGRAISSVDVSPLLNYIGGRIEEAPGEGSEMLPLVDYGNPGAEPPFYFINPSNFAFFVSGSQIYPSRGVVSGGAQIISFSASSSEPDSFTPLIYYGNPSGMPNFLYAKIDSSTSMPARFPLETALAGPIVLDELSPTNPPNPTGNTVSLVTEQVEGDVPAYRFTLYSGSVEMRKVLRLYPSCDGNIDLSDLQTSIESRLADIESRLTALEGN